MKVLKVIFLFFACFLLTACAAKPEHQVEKNNKSIVDETAEIPSHIKASISCADGSIQEIDADVIWSGGTSLYAGQVCSVDYNTTDLEEVFQKWTDSEHGEFFQEGETFSYYDNRYGEDNENYDSIEGGCYPQQVEEFINQMNQNLGTHQLLKECYSEEILPSRESAYEFYTSVGIDDIPMIVKLEANDLEYNGSGRILANDGKLIDLMITDFEVDSREPQECLSLNMILMCLEELLQQGIIEPISSGQSINQIQMCYMEEKNEEKFEFYPAIAFYTSYVAEPLKGMDEEFARRYIVLDARDGSLVDYNTWR